MSILRDVAERNEALANSLQATNEVKDEAFLREAKIRNEGNSSTVIPANESSSSTLPEPELPPLPDFGNVQQWGLIETTAASGNPKSIEMLDRRKRIQVATDNLSVEPKVKPIELTQAEIDNLQRSKGNMPDGTV